MHYIQSEKLGSIRKVILARKEEFVEQKRQDLADSHDIYTELTGFRTKLLTIYADTVMMEKEAAIEAIKEWGQDIAGLLVERDLPLNLALEEISYYRDRIGSLIKEQGKAKNYSLDEFYEIVSHFNGIVDDAIQWVSKSYITDYTEKMRHAQYAIDELSVPVVQMTKEIGILPLVGDLDTNRAQILMENALTKASEYHLTWLILDLSAVPIIDTMVADQLFKVASALQLIGVNVVLSGIRPEIAQTMVGLGIQVKEIKTFASLHQAVSYANSAL